MPVLLAFIPGLLIGLVGSALGETDALEGAGGSGLTDASGVVLFDIKLSPPTAPAIKAV